MKISEILTEGGWDTTLTQNTVLHPRIVAVALQVVDQFVTDFNKFLQNKNLGPVARGRPTGSSAYHEIDAQQDPEKVYGDIDLQMIAPEVPGASYGQFTAFWNKLADEFIKSAKLKYVDVTESKPGHPIFAVGKKDYVQIDFMWHEAKMADWGATRVTPERGVKGLLTGNMYSVMGELLDLSIQHAGVQLKVIDGQHVPFSKQKDTRTITVTTNPKTYLLDTFKYLAKQSGVSKPAIDPQLKQHAGVSIDDVKISKMVTGVRGFAKSVSDNNLWGTGEFSNFESESDFLNKFLQRYEDKAMQDVNSKKRDKATTPQAIERANQDREKVLSGLAMVKNYFNN